MTVNTIFYPTLARSGRGLHIVSRAISLPVVDGGWFTSVGDAAERSKSEVVGGGVTSPPVSLRVVVVVVVAALPPCRARSSRG